MQPRSHLPPGHTIEATCGVLAKASNRPQRAANLGDALGDEGENCEKVNEIKGCWLRG